MRLISLNVALFEPNNDQVYQFLKQQKPDIVCLQEAAKEEDSSADPRFISMDHIDKATPGLKFAFFSPNMILKNFHRANFHQKFFFDFEFGGFLRTGCYFRSRFKIIKEKTVFVGDEEFKNLKTITDWSVWPDKQSKTMQAVDLQLPNGQKLRIINYHGLWTQEKIGNRQTLEGCREVLALAKEVHHPVIITGDFNLFPDTQSMKILKDFRSLVNEHNIKTTRPKSNELSHLERNVVDYILVSKEIKVTSFEVPDIDVSDHLPLILGFEV